MRIVELADKHVAIWGLGREGRAALAALRRRVPELAITLFCNEDEAASLVVETCTRVITEAPTVADLSNFDVVIKSPGISDYRVELIEAQRNGTRFTSGTALWFAENPDARVVAVTGTKGKSTTSALIAHLLRGLGHRVALAGNIGLPLLDLLDQHADFWVVELSSYQTRSAGAVELAVITNIDEEHLDWHGSRERYVDDKLALVDTARSLLVGSGNPTLRNLATRHAKGHLVGDENGWQVSDTAVSFAGRELLLRTAVPLPGTHNAQNLCTALTALDLLGENAVRAAPSVGSFQTLPHRLTDLGESDGLRWIDDSISTTPQAIVQALASLHRESVIVLVGGHERGLDYASLVDSAVRHPPKAIVTMGENGSRIASALRDSISTCLQLETTTLADAVHRARGLANAGDVILLSPGAPSFDQFKDYAERGRAFARLAGCDAVPDTIPGLGIA
ncbi:MAG: UDP-N-acetylmuramoyl-L-alanine--D-glutamate ligase [Dokdonella sp.]